MRLLITCIFFVYPSHFEPMSRLGVPPIDLFSFSVSAIFSMNRLYLIRSFVIRLGRTRLHHTLVNRLHFDSSLNLKFLRWKRPLRCSFVVSFLLFSLRWNARRNDVKMKV